MTRRDVLLIALDDALRPLEDAIVKEFCIVYNCNEKEIKLPIGLGRLVDMVNTVVQQQSLEEAAGE